MPNRRIGTTRSQRSTHGGRLRISASPAIGTLPVACAAGAIAVDATAIAEAAGAGGWVRVTVDLLAQRAADGRWCVIAGHLVTAQVLVCDTPAPAGRPEPLVSGQGLPPPAGDA